MQPAGPRHIVASYLPSAAFAPGTRAALERLGYRLRPAATLGRFDDPSWHADVRLVDARHLDRLPQDDAPIVLAANGGGRPVTDRRVVGTAPRPLSLGNLYPLLQRALETDPRRAARAPVRISARCTRADRRWTGEMIQLSETGCLLRAASRLEAGLELNLLFPLPLGRMISTRAQVRESHDDRLGLAFQGLSAPARTAIADYVGRRLATL